MHTWTHICTYICTHTKTKKCINYKCINFGDSQPGTKSLTLHSYKKMLSGISKDESCGRVEFSVSSLLVSLINTPVLPVCCRS